MYIQLHLKDIGDGYIMSVTKAEFNYNTNNNNNNNTLTNSMSGCDRAEGTTSTSSGVLLTLPMHTDTLDYYIYHALSNCIYDNHTNTLYPIVLVQHVIPLPHTGDASVMEVVHDIQVCICV